jgi:hypothetical protein
MISGCTLFVALTCSSGNEIKDDYMGMACSMHAKEIKCVWGFCLSNVKERDCLEGLGIDGRTILHWNVNKCNGLDSCG